MLIEDSNQGDLDREAVATVEEEDSSGNVNCGFAVILQGRRGYGGVASRKLAAKDCYWYHVCRKRSLLAAIKKDDSKILLLVALCVDLHCKRWRQQQIDLICGMGMMVEATSKAIIGISWMGGGDKDGNRGSRNVGLIPNDRIPRELYGDLIFEAD
ncbi:hypothetical protein BHE74_00054197 [Ensete ventricosum]|nr:hypothetical protein BHE74_00054197 [Ensete ventricosum]